MQNPKFLLPWQQGSVWGKKLQGDGYIGHRIKPLVCHLTVTTPFIFNRKHG